MKWLRVFGLNPNDVTFLTEFNKYYDLKLRYNFLFSFFRKLENKIIHFVFSTFCFPMLKVHFSLFNLQGLWIGLLCGVLMQTIVLSFIIWRTNWNAEVS